PPPPPPPPPPPRVFLINSRYKRYISDFSWVGDFFYRNFFFFTENGDRLVFKGGWFINCILDRTALPELSVRR
ncbi:hypothetical protein, partial [Enterobacter hormaechei]